MLLRFRLKFIKLSFIFTNSGCKCEIERFFVIINVTQIKRRNKINFGNLCGNRNLSISNILKILSLKNTKDHIFFSFLFQRIIKILNWETLLNFFVARNVYILSVILTVTSCYLDFVSSLLN